MTAARPSVQPIAVPGGQPGTIVNAYLLSGSVPALVDGGPRTLAAEAAVRDGLAQAGLSMTDLRLIVVTGATSERIGLVARIVGASGARVAAHPAALRGLTDWSGVCADRAALVARAGAAGAVPADLVAAAVAAIRAQAGAVDPLPAVNVQRTRHGAPLRAGPATWEVLHTPGRAVDRQALVHLASGALLCGDLLARERQTWPELAPRTADGRRPDALADLVADWRALGSRPISVAWPTYGAPIRAHRMLVAQNLATVRRRLRAVASALRAGADTVWSVMLADAPEPAADELPAALGSTVAALDWLVAHGRARRTVEQGVLRFTPAPAGRPGAGA